MSDFQFRPWPKIARLNRTITVTEKIDGTNAAVVIVRTDELDHDAWRSMTGPEHLVLTGIEGGQEVARVPLDEGNEDGSWTDYSVFAQSRTRFVTPGNDNHGFAGWVAAHADDLVETLGEGAHFGEWWGSGIQRKYGLTGDDKRFSLFNTSRWPLPETDDGGQIAASIPGLGVVPVLYEGPFDQEAINAALEDLRESGSRAAPRFMRPEGVVVWHDAARQSFKVTLEGDQAPKGARA